MPSPKWKLVVDIGEAEETPPAGTPGASVTDSLTDQGSVTKKESTSDFSAGRETVGPQAKDDRIDQVIAVLGKYMPSDPLSPLAPYVSGFMSLRLLLLRTSRTAEEEELVTTMLDSFTSYTAGGREQQ